MSTEIFTYDPLIGYAEGFRFATRVLPLEGGFEQRQRATSRGKFMAGPVAIKSPPNSFTTLTTFIHDRGGMYDTFLYKAKLQINNRSTQELLGEGTGTLKTFSIDKKYVDESAGITVYIDGVATTSSGYSFSSNNVAPKIIFDTAPALEEVVRATYEFYYPMRFALDEFMFNVRYYTGTDSTTGVSFETRLIQPNPSSHLV